LTREESRDLEHIHHFGGVGCFLYVVDISEHGHADFSFHFGEYFHSFFEAWTAERLERRAVGFIVGGLEDEEYAESVAYFFQVLGNEEAHGLVLNDAGTGVEEEGVARFPCSFTKLKRK